MSDGVDIGISVMAMVFQAVVWLIVTLGVRLHKPKELGLDGTKAIRPRNLLLTWIAFGLVLFLCSPISWDFFWRWVESTPPPLLLSVDAWLLVGLGLALAMTCLLIRATGHVMLSEISPVLFCYLPVAVFFSAPPAVVLVVMAVVVGFFLGQQRLLRVRVVGRSLLIAGWPLSPHQRWCWGGER